MRKRNILKVIFLFTEIISFVTFAYVIISILLEKLTLQIEKIDELFSYDDPPPIVPTVDTSDLIDQEDDEPLAI